jgi:hypothetical protein
MAIAMTVGATKIRILQESTLASMGSSPATEKQEPEKEGQELAQASCTV